MQWESPRPPARSLYIPHDTDERHLSSVTFRNIWSEEFLITYRCLLIPPFLLPAFLPPLPPLLSEQRAHMNPHVWTLICLVRSGRGASESTHGEVCTIDLWRAWDAGPFLRPSLSCNLSGSLSRSPFCWYFVSSGWICIFWIRVKGRKKRKTKDTAVLSRGSEVWRKKNLLSSEEVSWLTWQ